MCPGPPSSLAAVTAWVWAATEPVTALVRPQTRGPPKCLIQWVSQGLELLREASALGAGTPGQLSSWPTGLGVPQVSWWWGPGLSPKTPQPDLH